jgi:hypothetical protein
MSKYDPLQHNLRARSQSGPDIELSFGEIEKILGFKLPPSAREHSAWWANERGTHVQARAWMDAGWQVWRVSRSTGKVYFRPRGQEHRTQPRTAKAPVELDLELLSARAARMVADYANENGGDIAAAISRAIEEAATARRSQLIDSIRANAPIVPGDSTDMIRADRDAR